MPGSHGQVPPRWLPAVTHEVCASPCGICTWIRMDAMAALPSMPSIICAMAAPPHRTWAGRILTALPCRPRRATQNVKVSASPPWVADPTETMVNSL